MPGHRCFTGTGWCGNDDEFIEVSSHVSFKWTNVIINQAGKRKKYTAPVLRISWPGLYFS
jgi:hypothetical protein